jgi:hypothetical protein
MRTHQMKSSQALVKRIQSMKTEDNNRSRMS